MTRIALTPRATGAVLDEREYRLTSLQRSSDGIIVPEEGGIVELDEAPAGRAPLTGVRFGRPYVSPETSKKFSPILRAAALGIE